MKKKILLTSVGSAALASFIAIMGTLLVDSADYHTALTTFRAFATAGYIGLFSVVAFFVGTVFPKD